MNNVNTFVAGTTESAYIWKSNIYWCSRWCHGFALFTFGNAASIILHFILLRNFRECYWKWFITKSEMYIHTIKWSWENPSGVVANMLDSDITVNEFEIRSQYCAHFKTKTRVKLWVPYFHRNKLNSSTIVLQWCLWH